MADKNKTCVNHSISVESRECPHCGSNDVEPDTTNAAAVSGFGGNPNKWRCNECEYVGLMPANSPASSHDNQPEDTGERNMVNLTVRSTKYYKLGLAILATTALVIFLTTSI